MAFFGFFLGGGIVFILCLMCIPIHSHIWQTVSQLLFNCVSYSLHSVCQNISKKHLSSAKNNFCSWFTISLLVKMQFSAKVFLGHNINIILMEQLEYSLDPRLLNSNFLFFKLTHVLRSFKTLASKTFKTLAGGNWSIGENHLPF